ncbi:hypothetical protein D3C76_1739810 [compost metagenome]
MWAGVVGRIAGERLPGVALLGGLLIVVAVVVSELKVRRPREPAEAPDVLDEGERQTGL